MKKVLALLLLVPALCFGQITSTAWRTYTFLNFGSDTLKQNPVRAIELDANDTLWAGLSAGLAKGLTDSTFYHYLTTDSSYTAGSQNDTRDVKADTVGNLYLGTAAGLVRLNDGLWATQDIFNADSGFASSYVQRVRPVSPDSIYVGLSTGGLTLLTDDTLYTLLVDSMAGNVVLAAEEDSSGFPWFGADSGASIYMGAWFSYAVASGLPDKRVYSIAVDDSGYVWFGTPQGAVQFDGDTTWTDHGDSIDVYGGRAVYAISVDNAQYIIWFGTDGGVVTYKPSTLYPYSLYHSYTNSSTNDSLPSDLIFDILVNPTDSLVWIATPEGLVRLTEVRE